jgi:hypothetical protein
MDSSHFLSVWPIHRYFIIQICKIIGFSPVASHSSVLSFFVLGQLFFANIGYKILKYFFNLDSHFPCFAPIKLYRFNSTIKYKGLSLHQYLFLFSHNEYVSTKILFAFLIRALTSRSAALSIFTTLPRYVNIQEVLYLHVYV